jgi:alkaline phosphatase D
MYLIFDHKNCMKNMRMMLFGMAVTLMACSSRKELPKLQEPTAFLYDASLKPFYHGVASGDPLPDQVIIWTRVTPEDSLDKIIVTWEVSEDAQFSSILRSDTISTNPSRDYTVKVDVTGLRPNTEYYYRFKALNATSPAGRTRTAPTGMRDSLKFAVVSCSNWEWGYFNAYARIAEKNVDAVIHLGDYIYEYGPGRYGDTTIGRINIPPHEIITLQDYRLRYAQYHLDDGLRAMRAAHPLIAIWDDHEVANDSYAEGAQNHQPEEGDFHQRKTAARQAYYEWLPTRDGEKLYRAFSFGPLADLIMLDERLEGRSRQASGYDDPVLQDTLRTMLGAEQLQWLLDRLSQSAATWKIIGNQVIFSALDESFRRTSKSTDNWNGYPFEQKKIGSFIMQNKITNTVFLTGDTHASWAFEVTHDIPAYRKNPAKSRFALEFGTPSISSANWDEYYPLDTARLGEQLYARHNPHLKYVNGTDHGYLVVTFYPDRVKAEWYYVNTLRQPDRGEMLKKTIVSVAGNALQPM